MQYVISDTIFKCPNQRSDSCLLFINWNQRYGTRARFLIMSGWTVCSDLRPKEAHALLHHGRGWFKRFRNIFSTLIDRHAFGNIISRTLTEVNTSNAKSEKMH